MYGELCFYLSIFKIYIFVTSVAIAFALYIYVGRRYGGRCGPSMTNNYLEIRVGTLCFESDPAKIWALESGVCGASMTNT